ncbi:hypothetical protein [Pantoea sp. KPR_PJ]|uniref:hypothetical protein n=1 Tax=Pantoea sp. KPR_PJ TaxID=2738375 RepID=UPI003529072C
MDADRRNNLHRALWLARVSSVIMGDIVVRSGQIADPHATGEHLQGLRRCLRETGGSLPLTATSL